MPDTVENTPSTARELRRLAALERYKILDTPPEAVFDDIVDIAGEICGVPMAVISLVDHSRQWFKAAVGLDVAETPREVAFCAHAIEQDGLLLVEDATNDPRFATNPLVTGGLHLRFYAGAPLRTADGHALGTLCVLDRLPRTLTGPQIRALEGLSRQVMTQLELRRSLALRRAEEERETDTLRYIDRLRDVEDPDEIISITAALLGETLGVATAGYATVRQDGTTIDIEHDWTAPGSLSVVGTHSLQSFGTFARVLQAGEEFIVNDVWTDPRLASSLAAWRALRAEAAVNLPLLENNRLVAMFYALSSEPRAWTDADLRFLRDISARARHAIERRRAEHKVRVLTASLHEQIEDRTRERDRLWTLSRDPFLIANVHGVWERVNPVWTELLGWSEHELLGRSSHWMEHPDDHDKTRLEIERIAGGSCTQHFENRFRSRDGVYHWFSWTAVQAEGLLYCVARDISAEKAHALVLLETENQLRQAQKMEAVGQLTGGLAHDFNNLLTGITGNLERLQMRITQGRIGEVARYVEAAQSSARRAAALTHRLLAFSRRQTLDPKPTDVRQLVTGMSELLRRAVGPGIALEMVAADDLWNTMIDPGQLESALLNLCINAHDAMPSGGRLTIECGNKWLDERAAQMQDIPAGRYVSVGVSDTGGGMSANVIARAFDPFFTTKPLGAGTGLGLSMVYGFARQSGGQVRIYSEVGHGTLVCLYLPQHLAATDPDDVPPKKVDVSPGGFAETVLVVDDEATVRMLVVEILQDMGCTALEGYDGASGLAILNSGARIDLLVTDVGLPGGMNGRQLADAARVARPGLKVLFITGYAENAVLNHGHLDAGMHVLTKPFGMHELGVRIKGLMAV